MSDLSAHWSELTNLRLDADTARTEAVGLAAAAAAARRRLDEAVRFGQPVGRLAREVEEAERDAEEAATRRRGVELALDDRIGAIIANLDRESVFSSLDPGVPIALLPVRLETRFRDDELLVRIFPDVISVDDHEPELTDAEVQAGQAFWRATWAVAADDANAEDVERAAWRAVAGPVGSARAAWVVRQTEPIGGTRPGEPQFGAVARKADGWTQPAVVRTLPDRWLVLAYSGGHEIARDWSGALPDQLVVGIDPARSDPEAADITGVPSELRWTVEVAAAEEKAMLARLALPAGTQRIDRLVVLGVCGSTDPATGAARLAALLDAHHYTDGLSFIPQATPTNNVGRERSGHGREPAEESFGHERRPPTGETGSNAAELASALGIPVPTLTSIAHAGDTEQPEARAMHNVLWAATMGYWLDELTSPLLDDDIPELVRSHFVSDVRARGPLPALRAGRQPYGLLPVTSLERWEGFGETSKEAAGVRFLASLRDYWRDGVRHLPVVRAGRAPDQGLLGALRQEAVSRRVRVRSITGENVGWSMSVMHGDGELARQTRMSATVLAALDIEAWPYLATMVHEADTARLRLPLVASSAGPEGDAEAAAALARLRTAPVKELDAERADARSARSLLYLLGRQSALVERHRTGVLVAKHFEPTVTIARYRPELLLSPADVGNVAIASTSPKVALTTEIATSATALDLEPQGVAGTIADALDREVVGSGDLPSPLVEVLHGFGRSLHVLERTPASRLALLLGEGLDCLSHRLDAWLTAVATRRLRDLRAAQPTGIHLGAWGVVEDLSRRPTRSEVVDPPAGVPAGAVTDPANGGYIHAPSLDHATTAAVLRSGSLSHASGDPGAGAFSVDLSSDRVRLALNLLDGVREGQPLGALLGYRLERELHEGHPGLELDEVIYELRRIAPPPILTEGAADPTALPPRDVCDGLALQRKGRAEVLGQVQLTGGQQAERRAAVGAALDRLDDAVDALSDLLLAESVHQLAMGRVERAAAALDALGRGEHAPPEPEVVRTPRSGVAVTNRVAVVVADETVHAAAWPVTTPRAAAEPRIDVWASALLPDPATVEVAVSKGEGHAPITFPFSDLGLAAIDVVYEADTSIDARVLRQAGAADIAEAVVLRNHATPAAPISLAALLELASTVHGVIAGGRPLQMPDLMRPSEVAGVPIDAAADAELGGRAAEAVTALGELVTQLQGTPDGRPTPAHLDRATSFGISVPAEPSRQARLVLEVERRHKDAVAAAARTDLSPQARAAGTLSAVFGADFRALPLLTTPTAASLVTGAVAPGELDDELVDVAPTRRRVGRVADVRLYADALGTGAGFDLHRYPLPATPAPTEPRTNLLVHGPEALDTTGPLAGLIVDEWVEVIPAPAVTTGVAFHADGPGARAPQAILLAVSPDPSRAWDSGTLADVVLETLELAKLRLVDLQAVAWAGRFLPTTYIPDGDVPGALGLKFKELFVHVEDLVARGVIEP